MKGVFYEKLCQELGSDHGEGLSIKDLCQKRENIGVENIKGWVSNLDGLLPKSIFCERKLR